MKMKMGGLISWVTIVVLSLSFSAALSPNHFPLDALKMNLTRTPYAMFYSLVVTVSVGTPAVEQVLLMDTGSSLTWTQCRPCLNCFSQHFPLYDSAASSTFRKVPCGHPVCRHCVHGECVYNSRYGDGSYTVGRVATDTFSFVGGASAAGVVFGCSNNATPFRPAGHVSGIMGLARDPEKSILYQMFPPQKRRFSYCLARFSSGKVPSTTLMTFGDDVVPSKMTPALRTTPLVNTHDRFHDYNLNLLDISLGNRRVGFPRGTFRASDVMIDSGTPVPMFPEGKPYTAVRGEFERHYNALGLQKIKTPAEMESLGPCYRRPAGFRDYLNLTYHFQGADYIVDGKYTVLVRQSTSSYFCVAVQRGGLVVLGSIHQQNMRLVYDVSKGRLSFGAENC